MPSALLEGLQWLKHASFLYQGSVKIVFDPWGLTFDVPVDLVLVSHGHYDHCDPETVSRLARDRGAVVAAEACAHELSGNVRGVEAGQVVRVSGVTITATEAYNLDKPFHPRGRGVGFLVAVDGKTIFHAGDTDNIPETHNLRPDVALLPVGGTYTMNVSEAAEAARAIGARVSVPMHYGYIVGTPDDGRRFVQLLGRGVELLEPVIPFEGKSLRR